MTWSFGILALTSNAGLDEGLFPGPPIRADAQQVGCSEVATPESEKARPEVLISWTLMADGIGRLPRDEVRDNQQRLLQVVAR